MTFSWDTTHLSGVTAITGANTFDLKFTWASSNLLSPYTDWVTLTATDASSHQESETYYFAVPSGNTAGNSGTASWPSTISPDTVLPGARWLPVTACRSMPTGCAGCRYPAAELQPKRRCAGFDL